jgi:hypothetical protein
MVMNFTRLEKLGSQLSLPDPAQIHQRCCQALTAEDSF